MGRFMPEDPLANPQGEFSADSDPVDLAAVRLDDALLDQIASGKADPLDYAADRELVAVLASWRSDIEAQPYDAVIDTDAAVSAIRAGRDRAGRLRFLVPFASAAAVLAIAFTGVSFAAKDAKPGDVLWGLSKVLYVDHAHSVEAAYAVQSDLQSARSALSQGRIEVARSALASAQNVIPQVAVDDGRAMLASAHETLVRQLDTKSPSTQGTTTSDPSQSPISTPTTPTTPPSSTPPSSTSTTPPTTTTTPTSPTTSTSVTSTTDGSSRRVASTSNSTPSGSN